MPAPARCQIKAYSAARSDEVPSASARERVSGAMNRRLVASVSPTWIGPGSAASAGRAWSRLQ